MKEAAIAPPGVIPSQQPMNDERNSVTQYFGRSFQTASTTRKEMPAACPRSASRSSIVSRISLMPNRPITATRKLMPRNRSVETGRQTDKGRHQTPGGETEGRQAAPPKARFCQQIE